MVFMYTFLSMIDRLAVFAKIRIVAFLGPPNLQRLPHYRAMDLRIFVPDGRLRLIRFDAQYRRLNGFTGLSL